MRSTRRQRRTSLLGSLSGISISQLLVAGIVPGVLLSAVFVGYRPSWCSVS
ncbi:MAG: hypothetical protein ACREJV_10195 [Candidatus Rokuibacteriota bacterium]